MISSATWQLIITQIEQVTHSSFIPSNRQEVSGGCINSAFILQSKKKNPRSKNVVLIHPGRVKS